MEKLLNCVVCSTKLIGKQSKFCSNKNCKQIYFNSKHQNYLAQKARGVIRKIEFIKNKGGCCSKCGYSKNLAVLEFHHLNPDEKRFPVSIKDLSQRTFEECKKEADKCILLCSNCHREEHNSDFNDFLNVENIKEYIKGLPIKEYIQTSLEDKFCSICQNKKVRKGLNICASCTRKKRTQENFKEKTTCSCGRTKYQSSKTCKKCYNKKTNFHLRKVVRPTAEELENFIWQLPMTKLGEIYEVSDVCIKKWCKKYGITEFPHISYWLKIYQKELKNKY